MTPKIRSCVYFVGHDSQITKCLLARVMTTRPLSASMLASRDIYQVSTCHSANSRVPSISFACSLSHHKLLFGVCKAVSARLVVAPCARCFLVLFRNSTCCRCSRLAPRHWLLLAQHLNHSLSMFGLSPSMLGLSHHKQGTHKPRGCRD